MKYVYAFKNRLVGSFTDPSFDSVEPKDKARYANNFCILKTEDALKQGLNEMDLYLLGKYDDEHGKFLLLEEAELLIQLDKPFEQLRAARAALEGERKDA